VRRKVLVFLFLFLLMPFAVFTGQVVTAIYRGIGFLPAVTEVGARWLSLNYWNLPNVLYLATFSLFYATVVTVVVRRLILTTRRNKKEG